MTHFWKIYNFFLLLYCKKRSWANQCVSNLTMSLLFYCLFYLYSRFDFNNIAHLNAHAMVSTYLSSIFVALKYGKSIYFDLSEFIFFYWIVLRSESRPLLLEEADSDFQQIVPDSYLMLSKLHSSIYLSLRLFFL